MILGFYRVNHICFKTRKTSGVFAFCFSAARNPGFKILPRTGGSHGDVVEWNCSHPQ